MTPDRYAKDYKLVETVDQSGKTGFAYAYSGPSYAPAHDVKKSRRILAGTVVGWICFIVALLPPSHAMHVIWISIPFVFTAIPLWMLLKVALLLGRAQHSSGKKQDGGVRSRERTHEGDEGSLLRNKEADLLTNVYPAAAMFAFVLPALALIGQGIALARGQWILPGDAVFAVCAALVCAAGIVLFRTRPQVTKVKEPQAQVPEEAENGSDARDPQVSVNNQ